MMMVGASGRGSAVENAPGRGDITLPGNQIEGFFRVGVQAIGRMEDGLVEMVVCRRKLQEGAPVAGHVEVEVGVLGVQVQRPRKVSRRFHQVALTAKDIGDGLVRLE